MGRGAVRTFVGYAAPVTADALRYRTAGAVHAVVAHHSFGAVAINLVEAAFFKHVCDGIRHLAQQGRIGIGIER